MNTLLNSEQIVEILNTEYSLSGVQRCSFIRRGFNDHYLIVANSIQYIFRVYLNHKYYIESIEAFQFELDLLEHLDKEGVPVANGLYRNNGELLGWYPTEYGDRAFALFVCAPGCPVKKADVTLKQCFHLGKAMAGLHIAANRFYSKQKRYHLDLKYLVDQPLQLIFEETHNQTLGLEEDQDNQPLQNIVESMGPIEELVNMVNNISCENDEFGIIHGDLHFGNVHFKDDDLVMFDFDHCAYGWRAYDLSIAYALSDSLRDSMLLGYETLRPLTDEERACLPIFFKLRRLWDIGDMLATESMRENPMDTLER